MLNAKVRLTVAFQSGDSKVFTKEINALVREVVAIRTDLDAGQVRNDTSAGRLIEWMKQSRCNLSLVEKLAKELEYEVE